MGTEERKISGIEIPGKELSGNEISGNEISGKEAFLVIFDQGLECLGLNVTDEQKNLFYRYYRLVIETNQVMNLTSITDPEEFVYKHLTFLARAYRHAEIVLYALKPEAADQHAALL